ncbi:MAG: amidohydrolase family protein [Bryobacteraceae bacterium]
MNKEAAWNITASDSELFQRELDSFLPHRVFDAHAHFYRLEDFGANPPALRSAGPTPAGLAEFRDWSCRLTPGREYSALVLGFPAAGLDVEAANRFVAAEVRGDRHSRAAMVVTPELNAEAVRAAVRREKLAGLKCYHVYAGTQPTFEAEVGSYLTEDHARVAHEERLTITLHLVRARALADPANQQVIRSYAERYPNARFVLAHAGRGFNPYHTIEGIGALKGLQNVWFDTSAVCEGGAYEAIIETMGVGRLLYGSDFPVSLMRARPVALGDSFLWISRENTDFTAAYADVAPSLTGLESLRVLKRACHHMRLSDSDVERIFWHNATELFVL